MDPVIKENKFHLGTCSSFLNRFFLCQLQKITLLIWECRVKFERKKRFCFLRFCYQKCLSPRAGVSQQRYSRYPTCQSCYRNEDGQGLSLGIGTILSQHATINFLNASWLSAHQCLVISSMTSLLRMPSFDVNQVSSFYLDRSHRWLHCTCRWSIYSMA